MVCDTYICADINRCGHIHLVSNAIREHDQRYQGRKAGAPPGLHGITNDELMIRDGSRGGDADLQANLPGFRTELEKPGAGSFVFHPETLMKILTWRQQIRMLDELKKAATESGQNRSGILGGMRRTVASFFVFQCYLLEFGTEFNAKQAVHWLSEAASNDNVVDHTETCAQAWLWRISRALGIQHEISDERLHSMLRVAVLQGHRTALRDYQTLAALSDGQRKDQWVNAHWKYRSILLRNSGAVGTKYFFPPHTMRSPWDSIGLDNIPRLDQAIQGCLGEDGYALSLRSSNVELKAGDPNPLDKIYVNTRGHGLLHYAAATGQISVLRHMISKYRCDVNLPNQSVQEPPLICACESGQVESVLILLENGADPNGCPTGQEGSLHWLSSFSPDEMENVARRLISAGAELELVSGCMRRDVRGNWADWEHMFEVQTTPLGRAVLMHDLGAVKVLLKLGANPLAEMGKNHPRDTLEPSKQVNVSSPFSLAAVLTSPAILSEFISHIDGGPNKTPKPVVLDEAGMLDLAHGKVLTKCDTLSLQSRLVRCGADYKNDLKETLTLLYERSPFHDRWSRERITTRSRVLCKEVSLGNLETVECLLGLGGLGYDARGTPDWCPLEAAVKLNHEELYHVLIRSGAEAKISRPTPDGYISLLHVCASRPRHCRPGQSIADMLIAAGVPVEGADAKVRPPLATAIMNQNFDVATALLDNGADLGASYPIQINTASGRETKSLTVLGEVLTQHTARTLESLRFMFGKNKHHNCKKPPPFVVDPTTKLSVLHFLAGSSQFTHIVQITHRIHNLCLQAYGEPELINYRHPILGTALYHAAANGNKAMVERLLEHQADVGPSAGPDISESIQSMLRPAGCWTPLWAVILRLDEEFNSQSLNAVNSLQAGHKLGGGGGGDNQRLRSTLVQNLERIIELLLRRNPDTTDPVAAAAILKLQERKKRLLDGENKTAMLLPQLDEKNEHDGSTELQFQAKGEDGPVDLGILKESYWADSEIMTKIRELRDGPEENWVTLDLRKFVIWVEPEVASLEGSIVIR
ncbi:ankyrin repeat-containing domain protein [Lasiosphaeria ovina]|uniref:Ankyrin repeat-containing domain protein n=1 Tax=Lasiosphaeria ovina TaxID=92902 RepID=A0AAE0KF85_9PEZI|nr:ankyrin repeat-containing domain protein [Lasiosphaeria ovina]